MARTPGGIPAADWAYARRVGRKYKVDPLLLVAIGKHETGWGKLGDGRRGNVLGVGSYDSGSTYKYSGVKRQLRVGARTLVNMGARTLADVKRGKAGAWATDPGWERKVEAMYKQVAKGYDRNAPMPGAEPKAKAQTITTPGVDNSQARKQLQYQALSAPRPFALSNLMNLKAQTDQLADVAPTTVRALKAPPAASAAPNGAPPVVMKMLGTAVAQSKKARPYLWGGGHGGIAKVGDAVDCSGYWSMLLPGLKGPMVSGQMASYGKPGRGKWVTIYANSGHVLGSIKDPRTGKVRWFATSKSNPGGGAGEISKPSAGYLSSFTVRHPRGL